ncbi:MAG: PadR family transcriptional regulator [Dehalococcoidia bacterium]
MSTRELMPGEYAVLGLLQRQPMHGYEMARYFDRDDLSEVCPIEQSLLYTYLRNIEERELVSWTEVRVGLRPPRKLYELTDSGREAIETWLDEPVQRLREIRLEFLLKLYFLHSMDREREQVLLARQIEICEEYHARLLRREAESLGFARLVAASKRSGAESTLNWLREYAWQLEHGEERNG